MDSINLICEFCGTPARNLKVKLGDDKITYTHPGCSCKVDKYLKLERRKKVSYLLKRSGISEKHWNYKLEEFFFDNGYEKARAVVEDYLKDIEGNLKERRGIFMVGPRGTGKTTLLSYVLVRIIKLELVQCFSVSTMTLYRAFQELRTRDDIMEQCINVPVLLIDDIGESRIDYWNKIYLNEIINQRYEKKRTLFISSMRSEEQLKNEDLLGGHMLSRIVEMTGKGHMALIRADKDFRYE